LQERLGAYRLDRSPLRGFTLADFSLAHKY
jgi:hypothetical protein